MLIKELTDRMQREDNLNLKEVLEIRTYIPIAEKKMIFETILDKCFTVEGHILICDYVLMHMMFELAMVKYHTNLEVDITSEDDYDAIQNCGVNFTCEYDADYDNCVILFKKMQKGLKEYHSLENSIIHLSNELSENIANIANTIVKKVEDLDISKLGLEQSHVDKIKYLLDKYGK